MKATPSVVLGLATAVGLFAGAAGVLHSGSAFARSTDLRLPAPTERSARPAIEPGDPRGAPAFFENFDSYVAGSQIHGQGGWKGWFNDPAAGALVDSTFSSSPSNSINIQGASDLVHEFSGFTSGLVTVTAQQYIPTGYTGESYFIMQNTYNDGGVGLNWSVQVKFNSATGLVESDGVTTEASISFVTDEWVELRLEIDLDNDTQSFFYDDQLLYTGTWTNEQTPGGGALNIGAIDLYANSASPVYYDDISVEFGVVDDIFANGFECATGFPGCDGGTPGVYTDRATFVADLQPGFYEEDFASVPGGAGGASMNFSGGGFAYTISATGGGSNNLFNDPGIISHDSAVDSLVITFTGNPVTAIGGNFWASDINFVPTGSDITLTLSDGTIETFTSTGPTDFRGFITPAPITSITIDAPDVPANAWATLDNIIVGQ